MPLYRFREIPNQYQGRRGRHLQRAHSVPPCGEYKSVTGPAVVEKKQEVARDVTMPRDTIYDEKWASITHRFIRQGVRVA